jgi:FkbM family methyltransferase
MGYKRGDWIPSNKSIIGILLRLPLQLIPQGTIVPILRTASRGKKWVYGSGAHSQWLGLHEVGKKKFFQKTIKSGSIVYDIGANVGIYTILSSILCGNSGRVYAFEPVLHNIKYLKKHIELNNLQNVSVIDAAVSNNSGRIFFHDNGDHCTSHISNDGEMDVASVSIDDFVFDQNNLPPDYLKIDVEGAENLVIEGGKKTLTTYKPNIFLATHGYEIDQICRNQLKDLNYKLMNIPGYDDEIYAIPE